jgi:hypothetical protein
MARAAMVLVSPRAAAMGAALVRKSTGASQSNRVQGQHLIVSLTASFELQRRCAILGDRGFLKTGSNPTARLPVRPFTPVSESATQGITR